MPRTTAHRTAALATAVAGPLLLGLWAAGPAQAHGAPTDPVSRVYACSPEGGADAGSAACRAAVRAGGTSFAAWDNLRVADVNGRDRQTVPDGKLCSGGLTAYRGLDLARADWPSTRLTPGGTLRMTYASTIAHEGTFRLYLTKPGYDPSKPLTWSDLPERPFAEVRNPALRNGAYRFTAKLPADRTGRQVLYTIWQNSSTPDTYYSCSDVVFPQTVTEEKAQNTPAARASAAPAPRSASPSPSPTTAPATAGPSASPVSGVSPAQAAAAPESTPVAADTGGSGPSAPMLAGGAATVLLLTGGAALTVRLRRR
ncbi:putative carbohydrate-binding protein with CBM5 and CBM33 domain [Streptomyces sp. B4I13]|uniref:lytic polysaccharide monooxygenase auxiliary activity family 9 protein n=1 Tax=Streptomyces sp. B4I13 TaxID=3042271 RepID=UPI0027820F3A|nr:lytic polysaccharide monooxygenase [Streptomyces sp. B4I13]MDQ0958390.1 putative carbohydrate-binding protein with CBM5 and CBM33 domain [Streptomyces sp. B4I13]